SVLRAQETRDAAPKLGVLVRAAVRQKKTGRAVHAACSRRAASSKPALWPLIIVPIVLPRIVVLAAAPERIVETPATPAEAEVVTAHDADIGRARAVDDAALRLVVQRNDELRAVIGLAVQRLVRNDERGPRQYGWRNAIEHILRDGD